MRILLFTGCLLVILSCKNGQQKNTVSDAVVKDTVELPIVDTGQTWYRINITRNDSSYINYEGTWPVYLTTEGFATLAFTAGKGAFEISHGLTLYIKGLNSGRMSVVRTERENGQVSMIFIPEGGKWRL